MALPTEVDPNSIIYYDANGNVIGGSGSSGTTGNGSIWSSIFSAIPQILGKLFPTGIGGNNQQYPYVTTTPQGTQVNLAGNNNNLLMIILVGMVAYLILSGKSPVKVKR